MVSIKKGQSAFTLVELLVTMAILAILAALVISVSSQVRVAGDRSKAISNMRSIGSAVLAYAADNDTTLPGPLWPGQMPELDPTRAGRLVRELSSYLDIEMPASPVVIDLFVPLAYRKVMGGDALSTSRTYVMNMAAVAESGGPLNPWGSLVSGSESSPLRLASVPHDAWGFSDADQQHPRVIGASWSSNTPEEPVHGKRLAWFFNGGVKQVDTTDLE